ncbi:MAG: BON domain-containing protein [Dechloromonas sp.]|nr:BON domain-containing protein [Dechloromonas sp.]
MKRHLLLTTLAAALALPALQGCVPAVVATGAAAGVMSLHDRRSTGTQTDDESTEWKASARIPDRLKNLVHVNFTAYNRRLLITGEVPSEEDRATIEAQARMVDSVKEVYNELAIGPISSLANRSNDSFIDSKVKARLVDTKQISANHIKVVTERGITYLMGIVNEREAKIAIQVARTTAGVRKVVNLFEVVPESETRRIDTQVAGAHRAAPVESR